VVLGMKVPYTKRNPMAQDLRQPKYKQQVIPNKKKPVPKRKEKHKGKSDERT
jgi:ribosomal protein L44E